MIIKDLSTIPLPEIIDTFLEAFSEYFVKMPEDISYWENRFNNSRVDYSLSFGAFDNGKLVAFIINGVDDLMGVKTAYNTGTGVIKSYRGQHLVDKIYQYCIPILKENGIHQCSLEVICENHVAIKVYERIGFEIKRKMFCFGGHYESNDDNIMLKQLDMTQLNQLPISTNYDWGNAEKTIQKGGDYFQVYQVLQHNQAVGHFIINESHTQIHQIESYDQNWASVFNGISTLTDKIKINNIDENRKKLIHFLESKKIKNLINQYEMFLSI